MSHAELTSVVRLAYRTARLLRAEALRCESGRRDVLLTRAGAELQRARAWHQHLDELGVRDRELDDLRSEARSL